MPYGTGNYGLGAGAPYGIVFQNFGTFAGAGTVDLDHAVIWDSGLDNILANGTVPEIDADIVFAPKGLIDGTSATKSSTVTIFSSKGNVSGTATSEANEQVGLGWDALDDTDPNWTEIQD